MNKCKATDCIRDSHSKGYCQAHYQRLYRTGCVNESKNLKDMSKTVEQRMGEKSVYIPMCGCRVWTGANVPFGYGVIYYKGKQQYAHRVAWETKYGEIGRGLLVLHTCDVPSCINTDHLFLGTTQDNIDDMSSKGRSGWHHKNRRFGDANWMRANAPKGENNANAKLTQNDVIEIRTLYKSGETQKNIACKFGIQQPQVSSIIRGASWA